MCSSNLGSLRPAHPQDPTRVLGCTKHLLRKQCKVIAAGFDAAAVTTEQLRVWAVVAGASCAFDAFPVFPLLDSPHRLQRPAIGLRSSTALQFENRGELGRVATGEGLRVVRAVGLGLKWFEPHSLNEFTVVLAQADGSAPLWLTSDDVAVTVLSTSGSATAATARVESDRRGAVRVVYLYGASHRDTPEAVLQLRVCGVAIVGTAGGAAGDGAWAARVRRRPLAGHECVAAGLNGGALNVVAGYKLGMAVSADEQWLVVGLHAEGVLSVYSLPEGGLVRTFGGVGAGACQFDGLCRLCFAPNGHLVAADQKNKRLQEVTLEGVFVRSIGVGAFGDGQPFCVAVRSDVIAVGCAAGTGPRVLLLEFGTGVVTSRFGKPGTAPGQLSEWCTGVQFTPDGSHVVVTEWGAQRLSLWSTAGVLVRFVGVGELGGGFKDALLSVQGEYVVADSQNHRVCVFSPDGSQLCRSWGAHGTGVGLFDCPTALAVAGQHLYVMDYGGGRVQVFE